ncbi:MAG: cold-shock protein [Alphaproteobacteria bacterium]
MTTGTVKWFNGKKGYGFITPDNGGEDVFVHVTAVKASGIRYLNENDKVSYELVEEKGKMAASNLKVITE